MTASELPPSPSQRPLSPERAIRDLQWVVTSPSLVNHIDAVESQPLDISQVDGDQLVKFLVGRPSYRVGRYFESLVAFWLEYVLGVEMVGHGVQIKDGSKTVGEVISISGRGRPNEPLGSCREVLPPFPTATAAISLDLMLLTASSSRPRNCSSLNCRSPSSTFQRSRSGKV